MGGRRPERVAHLLQAELARLLLTTAKNPQLRAVTITGVRITPDLRHARVFFRTLGDPAHRIGLTQALEGAAGFLRGQVGRSLGLRVVPVLRFEWDDTPDTGRRLDALLRAVAAPAEGGDGPPEGDEGA